mgnify:CR=1 FL=1
MLTAEHLARIQSALDTLALLKPAQIADPIRTTRQTVTHRGFVEKVVPAAFYAECRIATLDVWATGPTRIGAIRACLKALRNAAALNAPTLVVPVSLCEPRKAKRAAK